MSTDVQHHANVKILDACCSLSRAEVSYRTSLQFQASACILLQEQLRRRVI
jgi:hypothetical protein